MSWIKCNDWCPPIGVYVEVSDTVQGTRHIACLCEEANDIFNEGPKIKVWRYIFYNPLWPNYWSLLREGPVYYVDEE